MFRVSALLFLMLNLKIVWSLTALLALGLSLFQGVHGNPWGSGVLVWSFCFFIFFGSIGGSVCTEDGKILSRLLGMWEGSFPNISPFVKHLLIVDFVKTYIVTV